ncbi:alpha/beta hydrolase [Companilactobacillus alimentarius]|uniref:Alpha/beta hydrolase n=1 Tax=Companilactobacillus alimentarius DSM 20249 TaxID=1423720 RepID=A0A2K9HPM1_9LACO|nr:alpha/beta hydrolase [Companilactobacillus alimentarius]AUI71342.1 alpha/beta hydrolase [Companilactobacillus alimentarius DSM 20249]KRK74760.1 extracellular hydrolase precursor (lipase esterase) [Companilactobacillus alimentarius DSM 20249]GEO44325.1 alpha/beta hydrolase [Companilactobacillus alimentarius]
MKKFIKISLSVVIGVILVADIAASGYMFNYAFNKTGYSSDIKSKLNKDDRWFLRQKQDIWQQTSKDNLKLKARFLPAEKETTKTVVVVHGFGSASKYMGSYVRMFHNAGYNVLSPDNRAYGMSQGQYTGFGWSDRLDIVNWIKKINHKYGSKSHIGLFGVSMGAATVMYTLGEHPKNVDFAVADCGYSTISGELTYELKDKFNLPSFPIVPTASLFGDFLAGYNFYQASTKNTLKNNKVPLFIIHSGKDKFVPTANAYKNYRYDNGPKKLWIVKNAAHAESFDKATLKYITKVTAFSQKYF